MQTQKFNFQINAFLSDEPQSAEIMDVRGSSFKIAWMTEKPVIGGVKLTESSKVIVEKTSSSFHVVEIKSLQPGDTYKFSLLSDGVEYKSDKYQVKTSSSLDVVKDPLVIFGQVFNVEGTASQPNGLVVVQLLSGDKSSAKMPAQLNNAGGFQVNLAGAFSNDAKAVFNYGKTVDVEVSVFYDVTKPAVTKKYSLNLSANRQIPNIYLGDINIDVIPGVNGN